MNVDDARRRAADRLAGVSETPQLDADVLLASVLDTNRVGLLARGLDDISNAELEIFERLVERRVGGEPVAYITGRKAFRLIELMVDRRVLVPRPETEMLVDVGLLAMRAMPGSRAVLDVGTGSGAVALALASELWMAGRDDVAITASDISQDALEVAGENRRRLGLDGIVELTQADVLEGLGERFDVILANLPYLRDDQRHPSTACEPDLALYAGEDGLDVYRRLFEQAQGALTEGGIIACEVDPGQAEAVTELARRWVQGEQAVLKDLAGRERVLLAGVVDMVHTVTETFGHGARLEGH